MGSIGAKNDNKINIVMQENEILKEEIKILTTLLKDVFPEFNKITEANESETMSFEKI